MDPQVQGQAICDQALNQMPFHSCGSSHMINYNKSTVASVRSAMISQFRVRPTSKRWFLKIIQVTLKHDPLVAMQKSMYTLHSSCIHILRWSLQHSVKQTWTASAFSTNGSAWSVMVAGSQSHVWSGPKVFKQNMAWSYEILEYYTKYRIICHQLYLSCSI